MTLLQQYEAAILRAEINDDPLQRDILHEMQRLADELKEEHSSWWPWRKSRRIQGIYLYGTVGVGKTYLVDLFYQYVEEDKKARFHFHHFMQQIDMQLRSNQGKKNPLKQIARNIAKTIRLLCFDEFLVHDVAYAMILAELFQELDYYGVILVISSNTRPDDLYLNGVQRARFLPAIHLIKKHCKVLCLIENRDYRLGRQPLLNSYFYPLNQHTQISMEQQFALMPQAIEGTGYIKIQNREIPYLKRGPRSIWFAFDVLCNVPRSQLDYIEIADKFDSLLISEIPRLTESHTIQTIMLIHCIDILYDRGIKLIISAAVPAQELYVAGEMQEAFQRTLSRLLEMQSQDYLGRHPHRMNSVLK